MNNLEYKKNDTIVISDFHLGNRRSRPEKVNGFLAELLKEPPKRLVIAGDAFELWSQSYKEIGAEEHRIIKMVMELSEAGTKVVYIPGNHDRAFRAFFKFTFGKLKMRNEYVIHHNHKKYLVTHGDEFDAFTRNHAIIGLLLDQLYVVLVRINKFLRIFSRSKKSLSGLKSSKRYAETVEKIRNLAISYARSRKMSGIIIGHTHWPETVSSPKGIVYVNSGDWLENFSYVVVGDEVELKYYK